MPKNFLSKLIYYCLSLNILLLPIFFLTGTSEAFNFNKQYFLYATVLIALVAWAVRGVIEKKIELVRTPLDIPILVMLLVTFVASLASTDRHISFWGDLGGLTHSFISFTFYALLYFLAVNTFTTADRIKTAIILFSSSMLVAVLYFLVRASKIIPLPSDFPAWNPASNLLSLFGVLASVVIIFGLGNMMARRGGKMHYFFWIPTTALMLVAEFMIGFRGIWTSLVIGLVLLLIFSISRLDDMQTGWVSVTFALLVVALLLVFLGTPKFLTAQVPSEVSLSPSVSWQISRDTVSSSFKNFLFGSGPATFIYDFSKFRPESFNSNFAWNVRFLKPYGSIFELLATTGLLGFIALIILLLTAAGACFMSWFKMPGLVTGRKGLADVAREVVARGGGLSYQYFLLFAAWLLLAVQLFIIGFETTHWWLFFMLLALLFATPFDVLGTRLQKISLKTSPQYSLVSSFVTILIFVAVIMLGVYLGRFYAADIYAVKALGSGSPDKSIALYTKAVSLSPNRYQYHLGLGSAYITRASEELGKSAPNADLIRELVARSVNEAKIATDSSPRNVTAWEVLANMYANARALTNEAIRFQISALEEAVKLEPTNPLLSMSLGSAKLAAGNVAEARDKYKESVRLKPDFVPGYVALALLEEQAGNASQSIEYMATAAQINPTDATSVFNLARLYYNRGEGDDTSRAEQLFLYAIQLNPNYSDALLSLGILNERRGNLSEALRYYRRVQALNPGNAEIRSKVQSLLAPPPAEENDKKKK